MKTETYAQTQKRNKERATLAIKNGLAKNKEIMETPDDFVDRRPLKLRIKGFCFIAVYVLNFIYMDESFKLFEMLFGHVMAGIIVYLFGLFLGIFLLFFAGIVMIISAPQGYVDDMWSSKYWFHSGGTPMTQDRYNNIERVGEYVNSRTSISDRDTASSMMAKMGAINSMSNTSEGRRSLEFMNSKMSLMTREDGFKYISGKLRD